MSVPLLFLILLIFLIFLCHLFYCIIVSILNLKLIIPVVSCGKTSLFLSCLFLLLLYSFKWWIFFISVLDFFVSVSQSPVWHSSSAVCCKQSASKSPGNKAFVSVRQRWWRTLWGCSWCKKFLEYIYMCVCAQNL